MRERFSKLRRDSHHGGWVLVTHDPEREQLLAVSKENWPQNRFDALQDPQAAGAVVVWSAGSNLPGVGPRMVRVAANRFPLYRVEGQEDREGVGMYDMMRGLGAHEIVIESDNPQDTILTMKPQHYALSLQAFRERITDLRKDQRMRSFSIFREWECGKPAHPHSQLIASAIIPLGLKDELVAARDYYNYKERCLFCDAIKQEINEKERLVKATAEYVSYCPFASRYPFEIHLFSRRHSADFCTEPPDRFPALAEMIRDAACRLEAAVPGWRILMVLHTMPVFPPRREYVCTISLDYHWHIEFLPQPPGFLDWFARTGTHVECTPPEEAAAFLRGVKVSAP